MKKLALGRVTSWILKKKMTRKALSSLLSSKMTEVWKEFKLSLLLELDLPTEFRYLKSGEDLEVTSLSKFLDSEILNSYTMLALSEELGLKKLA